VDWVKTDCDEGDEDNEGDEGKRIVSSLNTQPPDEQPRGAGPAHGKQPRSTPPGQQPTAAGAAPTDPSPKVARDVMAIGHEVGRVLSDGRVVPGREPYVTVFRASRQIKREVGLLAWGILEDIALSADLDADGRLVAATSIRQIADHLGVNKSTVNKHLHQLRRRRLVVWQDQGRDARRRFEPSIYVIEPAAGLGLLVAGADPRAGDPAANSRSTGIAADSAADVVETDLAHNTTSTSTAAMSGGTATETATVPAVAVTASQPGHSPQPTRPNGHGEAEVAVSGSAELGDVGHDTAASHILRHGATSADTTHSSRRLARPDSAPRPVPPHPAVPDEHMLLSSSQQQHACQQHRSAAVGGPMSDQLAVQLRALGVTTTVIDELLRRYQLRHIQQQLAWLPRRNPRQNPAGLLVQAIRENWAAPPDDRWPPRPDDPAHPPTASLATTSCAPTGPHDAPGGSPDNHRRAADRAAHTPGAPAPPRAPAAAVAADEAAAAAFFAAVDHHLTELSPEAAAALRRRATQLAPWPAPQKPRALLDQCLRLLAAHEAGIPIPDHLHAELAALPTTQPHPSDAAAQQPPGRPSPRTPTPLTDPLEGPAGVSPGGPTEGEAEV